MCHCESRFALHCVSVYLVLTNFLVTATGNAFHGACACAEAALAAPPIASRISYLQQTLAQVSFNIGSGHKCSAPCILCTF